MDKTIVLQRTPTPDVSRSQPIDASYRYNITHHGLGVRESLIFFTQSALLVETSSETSVTSFP